MSRDELYFVLLKVFGFTLVVKGVLMVPQFLNYLLGFGMGAGLDMLWPIFSTVVGVALEIAAGYVIILKSGAISGWLAGLGQGEE